MIKGYKELRAFTGMSDASLRKSFAMRNFPMPAQVRDGSRLHKVWDESKVFWWMVDHAHIPEVFRGLKEREEFKSAVNRFLSPRPSEQIAEMLDILRLSNNGSSTDL